MTTAEIQQNIKLHEKLCKLILDMLEEIRKCKNPRKREELFNNISKLQRKTATIAIKFEADNGK